MTTAVRVCEAYTNWLLKYFGALIIFKFGSNLEAVINYGNIMECASVSSIFEIIGFFIFINHNSYFLYLYHSITSPTPHPIYMGSACQVCHIVCDMLSKAAYLVYLSNWPRCSNGVVRQAAFTKDRQERDRERRLVSWGECWSDHLFLPSSRSSSFPQTVLRGQGWVTKAGERIEAEREWARQGEIDR